MKIEDDYTLCPVCGHTNQLSAINVLYGFYVAECETVCKNETCNHEDYWAHGSYMYYSLANDKKPSKFEKVLQWFKKLFK